MWILIYIHISKNRGGKYIYYPPIFFHGGQKIYCPPPYICSGGAAPPPLTPPPPYSDAPNIYYLEIVLLIYKHYL